MLGIVLSETLLRDKDHWIEKNASESGDFAVEREKSGHNTNTNQNKGKRKDVENEMTYYSLQLAIQFVDLIENGI